MLSVNTPSWNKNNQSYSFELKTNMTVETKPLLEFTDKSLPDTFQQAVTALVTEFIERTKQWFASPLKLESSLRRLKHSWPSLTKADTYITLTFCPSCLVITSKEMTLEWKIIKSAPSEPLISADFLESTTPRAQSPVPTQPVQASQSVRTIQIQNTVDSEMVPVNDLPLSDILELESESKEKTMEKQRIREARLKVALAKLKAERMAQKYYMRYGEDLEGEESELSSVSDSDEHEEFARR
jgi:hypothetical protein